MPYILQRACQCASPSKSALKSKIKILKCQSVSLTANIKNDLHYLLSYVMILVGSFMIFYSIYKCMDYMNSDIHTEDQFLEFITTKHNKGHDYGGKLPSWLKQEFIDMKELFEVATANNLFNKKIAKLAQKYRLLIE